jgi:hypothetical protein
MPRLIRRLTRALTSRRKAGAPRPDARRAALRVELLESRQLLSITSPTIIPTPQFTPIQLEYASTASETDAYGSNVQALLGAATSGEVGVPGVSGALIQTYQGGAIYWSTNTGAHVVYGGISGKYAGLGGASGWYGLPTSDEAGLPGVAGVRVSYFQNGRAIYWSQATGARAVYGGIQSDYNQTASETDFNGNNVRAILGAPTSDEIDTPAYDYTTFQGGTIYWSQATGAHVVYGAIAADYNGLGGPGGTLGLPTSDVHRTGRGDGMCCDFLRGTQSGFIAWSPGTGAGALWGPVLGEYGSRGWENGLGYPTWDEHSSGRGDGMGCDFLQGSQASTIMWSAGTGAHALTGTVLSQYAALGWEYGLGYPTCDEQPISGGWITCFQKGDIVHAPSGVSNAVMYPTPGAPYSPVGGTLFNVGTNSPSYTDVRQGNEGDCWLMASLAEVAVQSPGVISKMFTFEGNVTANGSTIGVYAVRFHDSSNSSVIRTVTVDTMLPGGGTFYDRPVGGVLWAALAEKAYAEANGLGYVTGRITNSNAYDALGNTADSKGNTGGLVAWAFQALTGDGGSEVNVNPANAATAWNAGELVVLATPKTPGPNASSFIVSSHCYAMVGYSPSSSMPYEFYNPYGSDYGWAPNTSNTKWGLFIADANFLTANFGSQAISAGAAPDGRTRHHAFASQDLGDSLILEALLTRHSRGSNGAAVC